MTEYKRISNVRELESVDLKKVIVTEVELLTIT
jgi:hypothetical protein